MCETNTNINAIYGRDIWFSYFNSEPLLNGINITIKRGGIYGLLGSSGCGKTTLLKCILGRLKPTKGEIKIFGAKPGSTESHIPGPGVGYMPQELSLYFEFTIEEILSYFGRIYAMNRNDIKEKVEELIKLLNLPKTDKFIGGQQRRVSLACALIHSSPLLILDEPTVGTDPMLRQSIWFHLVSLCKSGHTIILTTHYIEETRKANTVAFMRWGKILAEEDPKVLLNKCNSNHLEEVFLKLCQTDNENYLNTNEMTIQSNCCENVIIGDIKGIYEKELKKNNTFQNSGESLDLKVKSEEVVNDSVHCISIMKKDENFHEQLGFSYKNSNLVSIRNSRFNDKCFALLNKNYKQITRKWGHLFIELICASILFLIMFISVGDGPRGLNLAIYDGELTNNVTHRWGQLFIDCLERERFHFNYFNTFEETIDSVKSGQNHASIQINDRFTKALRLRYLYMTDTDEEILDESQIYVHIDRSNQMVGSQIERLLYEAMEDFIEEVANRSNINPNSIEIPLMLAEPIYGDPKDSYREFLLPGAYIILTFFTTATITAHMTIEERKDGLLERNLVAGITAKEFLILNFLTQFCILCLQTLFLLLLPYILFNRQITGSLTLFITLMLSQGFCGVAIGLAVSIVISDIIIVVLILLCLFVNSLATAGVLWPIENMPLALHTVSKLMPNTIPVQSLRNILYRQWTIDYFEVYIGFVVTYVWIITFLLIAFIFLKRNI